MSRSGDDPLPRRENRRGFVRWPHDGPAAATRAGELDARHTGARASANSAWETSPAVQRWAAVARCRSAISMPTGLRLALHEKALSASSARFGAPASRRSHSCGSAMRRVPLPTARQPLLRQQCGEPFAVQVECRLELSDHRCHRGEPRHQRAQSPSSGSTFASASSLLEAQHLRARARASGRTDRLRCRPPIVRGVCPGSAHDEAIAVGARRSACRGSTGAAIASLPGQDACRRAAAQRGAGSTSSRVPRCRRTGAQ